MSDNEWVILKKFIDEEIARTKAKDFDDFEFYLGQLEYLRDYYDAIYTMDSDGQSTPLSIKLFDYFDSIIEETRNSLRC